MLSQNKATLRECALKLRKQDDSNELHDFIKGRWAFKDSNPRFSFLYPVPLLDRPIMRLWRLMSNTFSRPQPFKKPDFLVAYPGAANPNPTVAPVQVLLSSARRDLAPGGTSASAIHRGRIRSKLLFARQTW